MDRDAVFPARKKKICLNNKRVDPVFVTFSVCLLLLRKVSETVVTPGIRRTTFIRFLDNSCSVAANYLQNNGSKLQQVVKDIDGKSSESD